MAAQGPALCLAAMTTLLALLQLPLAASHAGHFHTWPIQAVVPSEGSAVLVGTCSKWQRVPSTQPVPSSIIDSTITPTSASGNVSINGTAKLWEYLLSNCSGVYTAALELDLDFRYKDGTGLRRVPIGGFTRTGTCAQGGGNIYLLDPAQGQVDENQLFVSRANTRPNGTLHGTTPNSGNITTGGVNGVRSIVLSNNATGEIYGCCDFVIPNPGADYARALVGKGIACDDATVEATIESLETGDEVTAPATATTASSAPSSGSAVADAPVSGSSGSGSSAAAPAPTSGAAAVAASAGAAAVAVLAAVLLV